ncbi:3-hydroxyacyl-CoA dehydrogenase [Blastochloris tepida]|uniref:3-hydroxyacyl-CoA dehydrogenase n=1 Tax=Blastochloris tepida TaxID=2233851 RepID=A0A348G171_9HYPH|nr:3-hydroxyacyl-CoA dehydrogenase [Blastochloris tepida]BBF93304.1 3-hydroxyacyl-CoA dehydrogenase [Blastochloris tepida]
MINRRLAIVGAGTMGTGIAINAAQNGMHVVVIDTSAAAVERAKRRAAEVYSRFVEKGRMSERERAAALSRLELGTAIGDVTRADLIIEAVFEDFAIKAPVFEEISRHAQPAALIATNTSALRVGRLAAHVANPGRFLGLHYFSPAEINPVVELVSAETTAPETADLAQAFLQATRRVALRCKDAPGFALNRFFCPYTNEAARLLGEGAGTIGEIERAAEEAFGAAAGPFRVMNLIKPRINLGAIRNLAELGPFYAPAPKMVEVGEADASFEIDQPLGPVDEARHADMVGRIRGAAFLSILQELDEDVAAPSAIDTGAKLAFKFSHPPCALMDTLGRATVEALIAPLVERYGLDMPASIAVVGRLVD